MRKFLLSCSLAVAAMTVYAEDTSDIIVISDLELAPGGEEAYFDVSLEGTRKYTAYNMDIHLPEGTELNYYEGEPDVFKYEENGTIYPYTTDRRGNKSWEHSLDVSYNVVGKNVLRVACSSNTSAIFTETSGVLFTVYIKASPFAKPGTAHITIDGIALAHVENGVTTKYVPADVDKEINITSTSKLTLNVSAANQWSTSVLPFEAAVPSGVTAYSCLSSTDDAILLSSVETMEAYKPYILYAPVGYTQELSGEVNPANYVEVATEGLLSGAIVPQTITDGYVMQNKGDGPMFYAVNGQTFSIPAGRCWLTESANLSAEHYSMETATSLSQVQSQEFLSSPVFTLDGKVATELVPGETYVKGGIKIMIQK